MITGFGGDALAENLGSKMVVNMSAIGNFEDIVVILAVYSEPNLFHIFSQIIYIIKGIVNEIP